MGRFRIQLFLGGDTWSTRYSIRKNDRSSDSSTDWTLLSLNLSVGNYDIKLTYGEIDTAQAEMCHSNISEARSVY